MHILKYGICIGGGLSIPNSLEEIANKEKETRPIKIEIVLNQDELKKFLEFKKSLDD